MVLNFSIAPLGIEYHSNIIRSNKMRTFKIIIPYFKKVDDRIELEKVYTLEVKNGTLKIDKDLILELDRVEQVSSTRYNVYFKNSRFAYKHFFRTMEDLEHFIKAEHIRDNRKDKRC